MLEAPSLGFPEPSRKLGSGKNQLGWYIGRLGTFSEIGLATIGENAIGYQPLKPRTRASSPGRFFLLPTRYGKQLVGGLAHFRSSYHSTESGRSA